MKAMQGATPEAALKSVWLHEPGSDFNDGFRVVFRCAAYPRLTVSRFAPRGAGGFACVYHVDGRGAFGVIDAAIATLNGAPEAANGA